MRPIVHQRAKRKVRNPLPDEIVKQVRGEKLYIINVSDVLFMENRSFGVFCIEPADAKRGYSCLEVVGTIARMDEGEEREGEVIVRAPQIAQDLLDACNNNIITTDGTPSFMGVFVSATPRPSADALASAQERLMEFYGNQVAEADRKWDEPKDHKDINSLMRRAAKALGLKKPWLYDSTQKFVTCPACGDSLLSSVPVCKTCGAIQPGKEELARKFFPDRFPAAPAVEEGDEVPVAPTPKPASRRRHAAPTTQE